MSTYDRIKKEGLIEALCKIIKVRFGGLPEWVSQKMTQASPETLSNWIDLALTKDELNDVFA